MIQRVLESKIKNHIQSNKILLLQGPKGIGKSDLVSKILGNQDQILTLDISIKKNKKTIAEYTHVDIDKILSENRYLIINEAQYLPNLQMILETVLMSENNCSLIMLCSFEPEFDEVLKEVLQAEDLIINIFPYIFKELAQVFGPVEFDKNLENRLIYGNYPEVFSLETNAEIEAYLYNIVEQAIFTNLNVNERINKKDALIQMLQIVSFEIGNPISYNDIAFKCGLDNETVERYIKLLVKSKILIQVPTLFNDNRYELKKTHVVYFIDNGLRNALIRNFNPINIRYDLDQLWKNWLISEKYKLNMYEGKSTDFQFWRTHTRQQIDLIDYSNGSQVAYKSIWDKRKKLKFPKLFTDYYPNIKTSTLNRSTYWTFLK